MVTKSGSLDDYNKLNLGYDFKGALLNKTSIESTEHVYRAGDGVFYKLITGTSVPYVHDGTDAPNMTYFEEVSQKATSDKLENLLGGCNTKTVTLGATFTYAKTNDAKFGSDSTMNWNEKKIIEIKFNIAGTSLIFGSYGVRTDTGALSVICLAINGTDLSSANLTATVYYQD